LAAAFFCVSVAALAAPLVVCLDYLPNPNHVPLYFALTSGAFSTRELDVQLVVPGSASDPAKLAATRSADIALTPQINYLMARAEGLPLIAIGVYVDHSLGGLLALADRGVLSISDLARRPIGYSLAPLEPALWSEMLACGGVSSQDIDLVSVGFATVVALLAGAVDAIGAFRNVEPIQVELAGRTPVFFPQESFCVPETYDLILVAHPDFVRERQTEAAAFLCAVEESIEAARRAPDDALAAFFRAFPELDDEFDRLSFRATLPLYAKSPYLRDSSTWQLVQEFLVAAGLLASSVPFESLVALDLSPSGP